ncbi:hypothetical protein ABMA27_014810 [Loxostege sticticalis]|uniref:Envelope fusion protein n=1 Tax=Loxostege sticticalis TaxID=481309 RepID=A0ABR3IAC3_LOXSC
MFQSCLAEPTPPASITPIAHSPGIYYDPITNIYFYNDYWKIITHIDIVSIEPHLNNIENSIRKVLDICIKSELNDFIQCKDIVSPIEILLQANYIKLNSLSHIISTDSSNSRFKRSLEFGGEILKFFFGTLDADDARKYDAAIEASQKSETELFHLIKDNIHIVKSTINSFNSTISRLSKNEFRLNNQIDKLNEILSQSAKNNNELLLISKINNLVNIIEGSSLTISYFLESVLNAILFSKANILHPSVITPTNLLNELSKHNHLINKRLDFPVPLNIETIHTIIDVSTLTSYYYNKRIVFIIQVPLISSIKYSVYKLIPLPTPPDQNNPNTFALIHPTKSYLAITDDRLNYALLDDLRDCSKISNDHYICPLLTIYSTNSNPSCETKLLTEVVMSLPNECNSNLLHGQIDIWQKLHGNEWIFVQSRTNKLTIKCNNDIKDYAILGTGLLKLSNDCIGYSKTLQFIPSTMSTFTFTNQFIIDFDITKDDCCKREILNKTIPLLSPLSLSNIDLDSLKHASHHLDGLENELNNFQSESHFIKYGSYYSGFTYFLITCIFLYLSYKLYNCICKRNKHNASSCCIQIFNQCHNEKTVRKTTSNSIELTDVADEIDDKISMKSLPALSEGRRLNLNKSYDTIQKVINVNQSSSSRNLNF